MRARQSDLHMLVTSERSSSATRVAAFAVQLALVLATAVLAQEAPPRTVDTSSFAPVQSSARTVADIVRDVARRRTAPDRGPRAAAAAPARLGEDSRSGYDWGILQTWLPDETGIQWCVDGYQSVQPVGGVKLYVLSQAYAGLRSLQPASLVVTLAAEEQIPSEARANRARGASMPHQFTYSTCVLPEFTRVGTYSTVAYSCGSERECASSPRVSPTLLHLKPFLSTFDVCVDRGAGTVEIFQSALYFDQRPEPASFALTFDGRPVPSATVQATWPWVTVDFTMPLADYDARFGANGDFARVALSSESAYTPQARMFFTKSDWLSPCIQ